MRQNAIFFLFVNFFLMELWQKTFFSTFLKNGINDFLKMGKNPHNYAFQLCSKNQLKIMIFTEVMVKNDVKNDQNILFKLSTEPLIPNLGVIEVGKSNETILFCLKTFFNPMRGGWGCFCSLGQPSRGPVTAFYYKLGAI